MWLSNSTNTFDGRPLSNGIALTSCAPRTLTAAWGSAPDSENVCARAFTDSTKRFMPGAGACWASASCSPNGVSGSLPIARMRPSATWLTVTASSSADASRLRLGRSGVAVAGAPYFRSSGDCGIPPRGRATTKRASHRRFFLPYCTSNFGV